MENFLVFILVVLFIYGMYYFILRISGLTHQDAKDGLTSFTIALPLIGLAFFIFTLPTFFFVNWLTIFPLYKTLKHLTGSEMVVKVTITDIK